VERRALPVVVREDRADELGVRIVSESIALIWFCKTEEEKRIE